MPKKYRIGASVVFHPAGPGKAYARKGRYVVTTGVCLRRSAAGWRLVDAQRHEIWADARESLSIRVSREAERAIRAHAFANISIEESE